MNDIYSQLQRGYPKQVTIKSEKVTTEYKQGRLNTKIVSVYNFVEPSNVYTQSQNLQERTTKNSELTNIVVERDINTENLNVSIKFLGQDDEIMYTDSNSQLLDLSNKSILEKLNINLQ